MTEPINPADVDSHLYQAYQSADKAASRRYATIVMEAQLAFEAQMKAAIDTYHDVEQGAWQEYLMTSRAAKRRYLDHVRDLANATSVDFWPPMAAPVPSQDDGNGDSWSQQPSFSPAQESRS